MSSIRDLNQNVILFVGRLSDSRKGLGLLLEAVELLTRLSALPSFALWIVGGSPREVDLVSRLVNRIPSLKALHEEGRILIWGRVENLALSELYSRACVTVIPSYREEFGIVAVEAMMCGSPVIAARIGGLQDVIREAETGALFEPDDVLGLAATLCSYLRNPQQRDQHCVAAREWAVALFSRNDTLTLLSRVYQPVPMFDSTATHWKHESFYQNQRLSMVRLSRLKEVLGDEDISVSPVRHGRHPVFHVEGGRTRLVAKFFTKRFSLQASLFPCLPSLSTERGGSISYCRVLYNKDNPVAPAIKYFEESPEPLIVSEWVPPLIEPFVEGIDGILHDAIRQCQEHRQLSECEELAEYMDALGSFAETPDYSKLGAVDIASARLNLRMTGGRPVLCRTHPQVELVRFRHLLNSNVWPLPEEFRIRSTQIIDLLLASEEVILEKPLLAHGDPKPEHILMSSSGNVLLVDLEHSRYAIGPIDLSLWFHFTGIRGRLDNSSSDVCERICGQLRTWQDRYLCMCWMVSEAIFFALQRFSLGDRRELMVAQRFFRNLGVTLLNKEVIR